MKKFSSIYFLVFFIVVFIASMIGLTQSLTQASESNYKQSVTAVVVKTFPPHYSLAKDGTPQGFAIDSIEAIARYADIKVNYIVKDNWTEVLQALKNGEADIIPNIGITIQRSYDFDFSTPIELSHISIIARNNSQDILEKSDLKNKVIGVVEYNIGLKIAKSLRLTYVTYSQPENALIALLSGQVEAVIYPKQVMMKIARQSGLEQRIKIITPPLKTVKRAIALRKNNLHLQTKLNQAIQEFKNSDDFRDIYIKWYGEKAPFWNVSNIAILVSTLTLITLIGFAIWRYLGMNKLNEKLLHNIDKRKKVEQELLQKKNMLHNVISSIPDLIYFKDANGRYISCNNKVEVLYCKKESEIIGKTDYELMDKKIAELTRQKDMRAIAAKEAITTEEEIKYPDGEIKLVETIRKPVYVSDSNIIGVLGIARDITKRKKLEVNLRTKENEQREILNSMIDAVITIDEKGKVLTFNKSAKTLFGYDFKEIIGKDIGLLMNTDDAKHHTEYLENFMATGETHVLGTSREVTGKRKNNTCFQMRLSVATLPVDSSGRRRFIGSCQDLTIYKQQEEQLRQTQKMDALGNLTGGIAHDFNNILGVIMGYSELLKDILSQQPDIAKYVREIYHASERGSKLTRKLLSFSRQRTPDTSIVNINTFLQDEKNMLEKTLTAKINLLYKLQENLWSVKIDENDLEDAILNICINAMHAMKSSGDLTIETHNEYMSSAETGSLHIEPGEYVVISVSDTGCGIEKRYQQRIFEPFFTTKDEHGTGLGLSQVYGFMERSHGNVTIQSVVDEGTTVSLYFPRYKKMSENISINKSNVKPAEPLEGNESILVVDDEPTLLEITDKILQQKGYTVYTATNAEHALELLEKNDIDLLLTDIIMQGMDGYQLAEIVHKKYPHVKIQLASGFTESHHKNIDNEALEHALIYKPFNSQTLLKSIRNLLS